MQRSPAYQEAVRATASPCSACPASARGAAATACSRPLMCCDPGLVKGRPGTDRNGPFRGLAKRQRKQYFPNDHARVHASPCSRHVTRSHVIKDRHGTLTAHSAGAQTKRETDRLGLSFGFTSLGHRARLIGGSAPLSTNTTHAGVAACTKPGPLPPETNARATFPCVFRGFVIRPSVP